jgi:UDP-2,4-diacetamido-2,4,6-trideoxy-beta-L-altropyranose hydrolase
MADATATAGAAQRYGASWIVADGYGFATEWLARVGECGIPLALWTDFLQAPNLPVSLLLNQNPHARAADYTAAAPGATLLLGLRFAVLRREFLISRRGRGVRAGVGRLLVTLGGSDAVNATTRVLDALALMGNSVPLTTVVIGANNPHLTGLRRLVAAIPGAELHHAVEDMPRVIGACDLAISAAGATLWELAYFGVPTITMVVAENQVPLAAAISRAGAGINVGWIHSVKPAQLAALLSDLCRDPARVNALSRSALRLVDGLGSARVCARLRQRLSVGKI